MANKYTDNRGYVFIQGENGYVLEHRWVVEYYSQIPLEPDEKVKHINGCLQDNRPINLELVTPRDFIDWTDALSAGIKVTIRSSEGLCKLCGKYTKLHARGLCLFCYKDAWRRGVLNKLN